MIYQLIRKISHLNLIFLSHLLVIGLVVLGILPRSVVSFWTVILAVYIIAVPLEEGLLFFVRSIPFFIAIPLTATFDSFNMWRIFSLIIFLKWLRWPSLRDFLRFDKRRTVFLVLFLLLILSVISIASAESATLALKRIIYFINLSLVGIAAYYISLGNEIFRRRLVRNIAIPTVLVALLGMAQLWSTYTMDIFQFIDFWGDRVERNLFGNAWADIALQANTWFAYFGDTLSLRMFSIFPDTHSFPLFLILGLPALLSTALNRVVGANLRITALYRARGRWWVLFVPIVFLAVILSGTRGMWAAGVGSVTVMIGYLCLFRWKKIDHYHKKVFKYLASYLAIFFLLFAVAYPIFASPQFQVQKDDSGVLNKRIRSIINFGETSNSRRIEIWKDSLRSIVQRPILGVGIGNFPLVVKEDLAKAKAGSSAHNLYLHIAAEMGIPALLAALYFLRLLLVKCYRNYLAAIDPIPLIYFGASLIFIPWNLIYSLTDIALFDERAFLLFVITVALIFGNKKVP